MYSVCFFCQTHNYKNISFSSISDLFLKKYMVSILGVGFLELATTYNLRNKVTKVEQKAKKRIMERIFLKNKSCNALQT